ncbi:MAG: hypothetical protein HDS53_00750 [Barnesiella sp.]|nr:hypothetical protein [Barnesiella sp.]
MSAHTFEMILFFIASTAVICSLIAIGAFINHYLMVRRLKTINMTARIGKVNTDMQNTIHRMMK